MSAIKWRKYGRSQRSSQDQNAEVIVQDQIGEASQLGSDQAPTTAKLPAVIEDSAYPEPPSTFQRRVDLVRQRETGLNASGRRWRPAPEVTDRLGSRPRSIRIARLDQGLRLLGRGIGGTAAKRRQHRPAGQWDRPTDQGRTHQ